MEPRILRIVYEAKQRDFADRVNEATRPDVVYVTDLTSCSQKRLFRLAMPLLSFRFEPPMLLGELVHLGLERLLEQEGWVTELEIVKHYEVDGVRYELRGRADAVRIEDGRVVEVVEIKTARSIDKPLEHHALQLQIYMQLLGAERGYLVYITPDKIVEYSVDPGDVDIERLLAETVRNTAHPRFEWECRYCPYRRYCPYARASQHQAEH